MGKLDAVITPLISQDLLDRARKAFPPVLVKPVGSREEYEKQLFEAGSAYAIEWLSKNCVQRAVSNVPGGRQ